MRKIMKLQAWMSVWDIGFPRGLGRQEVVQYDGSEPLQGRLCGACESDEALGAMDIAGLAAIVATVD